MVSGTPGIGIAVDRIGWWRKFAHYAQALNVPFEVFEIERSDWIRKVKKYRAVLWRPNLDPPYCEEGKEKIYFIEHVMRQRVFPNWATFWHYDNKRAQAYFFEMHGIPAPDTFCTYARAEAEEFVRAARFPLVSKNAGGASSEAVHLVRDACQARREIRRVFHEPLIVKILRRLGVGLRWRPDSMKSYGLWQEFIEGNRRDFRVTIIGQKYGFVFWRNNRPGDFRASGSGSIDYDVQGGRDEVAFCLTLCREHDFDSMAFDIVYREGRPLILEMSYAFQDKAIYNAPGHFTLAENGELTYEVGQTWPQELYVRYVRDRLYRANP